MAKKFVRGITDIKNIEHQDFDTNNVNDLLSDGEHNYIHRKKKDGTEEYHNLTDNIKTIEKVDNGLLTVTNYNKTKNSSTLHVHHDYYKSQRLSSPEQTILIEHGENGTDETTSVDVNPAKVLEHDNLISNSQYVTIEHEDESATTVIKTEKLDSELEIVGMRNYVELTSTAKSVSEGYIYNLTHAFDDIDDDETLIIEFDWSVTEPTSTSCFRINRVIMYNDGTRQQWDDTIIKAGQPSDILTSSGSGHYSGVFTKVPYTSTDVLTRYLSINQSDSGGTVTISNLTIRVGSLKSDWEPAPEDCERKLDQKQNTLTSNASIGVSGTGLRQLYTQSQTYTHTNGILKTHVKSVANSSSISTLEEEFNFLAKMNKSQTNAEFTLNAHDTAVFQYLVDTYGVNNVINVCGSAFTLDGSQLTFGSNGSTYNPHIITFSDIIPSSAINTQQNAPSRGDKVDETVEFDKTDEIVDKVDEIVDSKQSE